MSNNNSLICYFLAVMRSRRLLKFEFKLIVKGYCFKETNSYKNLIE